jgi:hypothetical protein
MLCEIHLVSWLPYVTIPNLLWEYQALPAALSPLASGPVFSGDHILLPPPHTQSLNALPVCAAHRVEFRLKGWGGSPRLTATVAAGTRHLLDTAGNPTRSEPGQVLASSARASYNQGHNRYEVDMLGEVTIPFLVEAARIHEALQRGDTDPAALESIRKEPLPAVGWQLHLCLQQGADLAPSAPIDCDESKRFFGHRTSLGGGPENRIHGQITFRPFPSYAVYVALRQGDGPRHDLPVFYFNGFGRNIAAVHSQETSRVRTVSW